MTNVNSESFSKQKPTRHKFTITNEFKMCSPKLSLYEK